MKGRKGKQLAFGSFCKKHDMYRSAARRIPPGAAAATADVGGGGTNVAVPPAEPVLLLDMLFDVEVEPVAVVVLLLCGLLLSGRLLFAAVGTTLGLIPAGEMRESVETAPSTLVGVGTPVGSSLEGSSISVMEL